MEVQISSTSSPGGPAPEAPARPPRPVGLLGFTLELLLPVLLTSTLLLVAASYLPFWDLEGKVGARVFDALVVLVSLVLSIRLDVLTLPGRRRQGRGPILNGTGPRFRLVKFTLGGLLLPIAFLYAARSVRLAGNETPLALAIRLKRTAPEGARANRVAETVLRSRSLPTKTQGIAVLQSLGTDEALVELLRVLDRDLSVLTDGGEARALSKALASFGGRARTPLLARFDSATETAAGSRPAVPAGDETFDRLFSDGFRKATAQLDVPEAEPALREARLAHLRTAEAELRLAVRAIDLPPGSDLAGFVMQTLLEMAPGNDPDLLAFARRTAADATRSDRIRGLALRLIARQGGPSELDELFVYLESPDPLLQARALQAISELQAKLSPTSRRAADHL